MTQEQMDVYKMRIPQASIGELVVLMLEMEMEWMKDAREEFSKGDFEAFVDATDKAQVVQQQLMDVMDLQNQVAGDVFSIFVYINKQLLHSKIKGKPLDYERCEAMLERLCNSFRAIQNTDDGQPVMATGEKVYAGLTYGSGGLVESRTGGMDYSV